MDSLRLSDWWDWRLCRVWESRRCLEMVGSGGVGVSLFRNLFLGGVDDLCLDSFIRRLRLLESGYFGSFLRGERGLGLGLEVIGFWNDPIYLNFIANRVQNIISYPISSGLSVAIVEGVLGGATWRTYTRCVLGKLVGDQEGLFGGVETVINSFGKVV